MTKQADKELMQHSKASTLVDESKRSRIQESLLQFDASKDGEHIGQLARAIFAGDVEQATKLIKSNHDIEILSNFRVDLVGRIRE